MKRVLLFAALTLLLFPAYYGQSNGVLRSMMSDALFLYDNYFDPASSQLSPAQGDPLAFVEVMQRNYQGEPLAVRDLIEHYRDKNPLFDGDFVKWEEADISISKLSAPQKSLVLSSLPRIAPLPLTSFALDLSDFLVQRTRQELNIAFFYRLYDFLDKPENQVARSLFPQTFQDLRLLENQIFDLQTYLEGLQVSFQRDLAGLPEHLVATLRLLEFENQELNTQLDLLNAFISVGDGIVRKKFAPVEVINSLANFPFPQQSLDQLGEFIGGVKLLNAIVYDGFWSYEDTAFLDFDAVSSRLENSDIQKIFLGLLFERVREIEIRQGLALDELFSQNLEGYLSIGDQLLQIASRIDQIQADYLLWEALSDLERNNPATYLSFTQRATRNFNDLFSSTEGILKATGLEEEFLEEIARWNEILSSFGDLVVDVNTENYSHAIMTAVRWLSPVLEDQLTSRILFFGSFIAAVVEADSPEQLAGLIETYALPPGSSAKKKHADWSLSLNSYVGVFFGLEKLETDTERAGVYGINAPLGLALSKGLRRGGAISLYGSIIDLGGIVAYRFNDENTEDLPQITLANLFAPGIYGVYGFGENIPLSLGGGYQWGPQIRGVGQANDFRFVESQGRINFFLGIDLHLLHLWNRPFAVQRP